MMYRLILFVAIFLHSFSLRAQEVIKVDLQASGLTCSMCSNAINKALRSLDFVEKVDANIKNSSFDIRFKKDAAIDFDRMKAKVEGAGFTVARFMVTMNFRAQKTLDDQCVFIGSTGYRFVNLKEPYLDGEKTIRIMDKGFIPAKEFKKNTAIYTDKCYDRIESTTAKLYHVIIS